MRPDAAVLMSSGAIPEEHEADPGASAAAGPRRGVALPYPPSAALDLTLLALPGALVLWLAWHQGGLYPGSTAVVAMVLLMIIGLRAVLSASPLAGFGLPAILALAFLAGLMGWIALSAQWSDAPGRALVEHDRALLYTAAFALFAGLGGGSGRIRWITRGLCVAFAAICACSLITRLLPQLWSAEVVDSTGRLSYPVTYWNALGTIATGALLLLGHVTTDAREHPATRAAAAAAVPVAGAVLILTESRAALVTVLIGGMAYVVLARPRLALTAAMAVFLPTLVAVKQTSGEDLPIGADATADQLATGAAAAWIVLGCIVAAGVLRALLIPADRRLLRLPPMPHPSRGLSVTLVAGVAGVLVVGGMAMGGPRWVADRFTEGDLVVGGAGTRLVSFGNNGREAMWRAGIDAYRSEPVHGIGAGTFERFWLEHKPASSQEVVYDAHSLYVELLAELGMVGLLLGGLALLTIVATAVARARGSDRADYAIAAALVLAWMVGAAVDWQWEVPAASIAVFALGGAVCAARDLNGRATRRTPTARGTVAVLVLMVCVGLAVTPWRVARSQSALDSAKVAFSGNECVQTAAHAAQAIAAVDARPEPWELRAYCEWRTGQPRLAARTMAKALRREPNNSRLHYDYALALAAAGRDPRRSLERSFTLAPANDLALHAVREFGRAPRWQWPRVAGGLPLALPEDR